MSCSTSTWPSHAGPAPIPIVGMVSDLVICDASGAGTSSSTIANAPASSSALASSLSRSAVFSSRPCTRCPPSACTDCGVRPRWPITGRSEEHTSELQSPCNLVCRLLLEKKKKNNRRTSIDPASIENGPPYSQNYPAHRHARQRESL